MESVIDAYLKQSDQAWQAFTQNGRVKTELFLANAAVNRYFDERYGQTLRWTHDQVRTRITEGCFPLHPLTTAFLCNIKLDIAADMGTPRTALGFVFDQLNARRHQPALVGNSINWVLPIELVDYFEARVAGEHYKTYENACRIARSVAPDVGELLIKARLLQEVAGFAYVGEDQVQFLAEVAGLDMPAAQQTLDKLIAARVIRYDVIRKAYEFWTIGGANPEHLERLLSRQLDYLPFDQPALDTLNRELVKLNQSSGYGAVPVGIPWGNESDWAAREFMITREFCTDDTLREMVQGYQIKSRDLQEGQRGALVWLLARNEEDIAWFRSNIAPVLDSAFAGDSPLPAICVMPREPHPDIIDAFQRLRALKQLGRGDQQKVGQELYNSELEHAQSALTDSLPKLQDNVARAYDVARPTVELIVPLAYRATINGLPNSSIRQILSECYKLAYRFSPPEFFTQYQNANSKLRSAVKLVANQFLRGAGPSLQHDIASDAIARELCGKLLNTKWRLLTSDFRLQKPGDPHIHQAWDFLDRTFAPSKREVLIREALIPLFNPPYGYDFNTVTLLFCAWFGANAHDLRLVAQNQTTTNSSLAEWFTNPKEFVVRLAVTHNAALARREPGEATREIQKLIDCVMAASEASIMHEDAEHMSAKLLDYVSDEHSDSGVRDRARTTIEILKAARATAQDYEKQARAISQTINSESDIEKLLSARSSIGRLPRLGIVQTLAAQPMMLQEQLAQKLRSAIETTSRRYETISSRTHLDLHRTHLDRLSTHLQSAGLSELLPRVNVAINNLNSQAERLEVEEREDGLRTRIQGLDERARLRTLYEHRDWLENISSPSQVTLEMRDKRLATIKAKIAHLERQITNLQANLGEIDSQEALDAWHRSADKMERDYQETPYQAQIEQLGIRAEPLRAYFAEVGRIQNLRLTNPQEVASAKQQLADLEQRYRETVGTKALAMIAEARKTVQDREYKRGQDAMALLAQLEAAYRARASLVEINSKLESIPPFLSDEGVVRWRKLNEQVQDQLDRNQVAQIELYFRKIVDVNKRMECINLLQSIMNETTQPLPPREEKEHHA
jgi:hypothetical protein